MTEDWCCPICLDDNEEDCYTLQPCNHKFHTKCIIDSLRLRGRECPYCRGVQTTSNNYQNIRTDDMDLFNTYVNYDSIQLENLPFGDTQQNYINTNSNLNTIDISNIQIIEDNNTSNFVRNMDAIRNNEIRSLDFNTLSNMFNSLGRLQEVDRINNAVARAMGDNGRGF